MPIVVQKYGGSSVGDAIKIREVAKKIALRRQSGDSVVVVVSAMGDTTDELLALSRQVTLNPDRRELDMLLTAGERISMALLSMALNADGVQAISFTGSQSGIITTDSHTNARIVEVRPTRILGELAQGKVVIVAGYQGVSSQKEVTTLGRGGSDTTAVALAAALEAEACEIYSDVDGVFSADPRVVPQARKLAELDYEEMQELAEAGAKVLNAQAVEFARKAEITLHARSTFSSGTGTTVKKAAAETRRVAGITADREMAMLTLADPSPEALASLLAFLDARSVAGRQVSLSSSGVALALPLENVHGYPAFCDELRQTFGARLAIADGVGLVSAVGVGINADHRHLRHALEALAAAQITVRGVQTSSLRFSLEVSAPQLKDATRTLHQALIG